MRHLNRKPATATPSDPNATNRRPWRTARSRVTSITHVVYFAHFCTANKKKKKSFAAEPTTLHKQDS